MGVQNVIEVLPHKKQKQIIQFPVGLVGTNAIQCVSVSGEVDLPISARHQLEDAHSVKNSVQPLSRISAQD